MITYNRVRKTHHLDKCWRDVCPILLPYRPRPRDGGYLHPLKNGMQGQTKKPWTEARVFWNEEVNLKRTCTVKTGNYGFGGNTTDTATTEADAAYEHLVHGFSSAFNKSQKTISGLTATNTQLQQQLKQAQMMYQAMTNCVPLVTYQMPFQPKQ